MHKTSGFAGLIFAGTLVAGSAFAQPAPLPPPAPPPPGSPAPTAAPTPGPAAAPTAGPAPAAAGEEADKKIGVGGDLLFLIPLGDLGDATGPQLGPVLRGGYRVIAPLELTGRIGYLFGLSKEVAPGYSASFSVIPIWLGARYFFMDTYSGVYGAAELGLNFMQPHASTPVGSASGDTQTRFGANLGAGYVISKELPIDFRAQLTLYNLLGQDSNINEKVRTAIGLSVGYTYQL